MSTPTQLNQSTFDISVKGPGAELSSKGSFKTYMCAKKTAQIPKKASNIKVLILPPGL